MLSCDHVRTDYDSTGYALTIPAGQTKVSRNITIVQDGVPGEGHEDFVLEISSVTTPDVSIGETEVKSFYHRL